MNKIFLLIFLVLLFPLFSESSGKARITAKSGLILRAEPNKSSKKIDKIPFDSIIEVSNAKHGEMETMWFQTTYNKKTGYVSGDFIDFNLEKNPKIFTTNGKFLNVEQGDYFHLSIQVGTEEKSFWIIQAHDGIPFEELDEKKDKYKNKTLKISWKKYSMYIPEAGSFETVDMVTKIELLK